MEFARRARSQFCKGFEERDDLMIEHAFLVSNPHTDDGESLLHILKGNYFSCCIEDYRTVML